MEFVALGKTDLMVSRASFGTGNIEKFDKDENACEVVRKGYEAGINFFDITSLESENACRYAFYDIRTSVILGAQTTSSTASGIFLDVDEFLSNFQTDYIDIFHIHNLPFVPSAKQEDGIFEALQNLKKSGKVRHIGFSSESLILAQEAAESSLFETIRYPFNFLANEEEKELVRFCEHNDIGFIAYKPLAGGRIKNIPLAFGFLRQFDSVVPVWGFSSAEEVLQIMYFESRPPQLDDIFFAEIEKEKTLLSGL